MTATAEDVTERLRRAVAGRGGEPGGRIRGLPRLRADGMTLRWRLNVLIMTLTVAFLVLATILVVFNARNFVAAEIKSAQDAVVDLLEATIEIPVDESGQAVQLDQLAGLGTYRHIDVTLRHGTQEEVRPDPDAYRTPDAPAWFSRLVKPPEVITHRKIPVSESPPAWLVVTAEPADEIAEAWQGARDTLALLLGFAVVANILVVTVVHRSLRPMGSVLRSLEELEQGRYAARLPEYGTPEIDQLAGRVNRLAAALEEVRSRNRGLNRRILDVQEGERRRVARELHDELGQSLTAIQAEAAVVRRSLAEEAEGAAPSAAVVRARESAAAIGDETGRLSGRIRDLVRRLRPAALDQLGLSEGLQELVRDWQKRYPDTECHLEVDEVANRLTPDVQTALYRMTQECLTNVARHSGASRVVVRLRDAGNAVTLGVGDDGCGVVSWRAERSGREGGFGLFGIQERIAGLGGRCRFFPRPGRGLIAVARVPRR